MADKKDQKPRCFVMMPFSDPDGYEKGHFTMVYDDLFKPAIEEAGFVPFRIDDDKVSRDIVTKIIEAAQDCEMAICDLSTNNPNVLYELGLRHAYDKPVALVRDDTTNSIFDVQGIATHKYHRDLVYRNVIKDKEMITAAIKETCEHPDKTSVVTVATAEKAILDLRSKSPGGEKDELLIRVLDEVTELKKQIGETKSGKVTGLSNFLISLTKTMEKAQRLKTLYLADDETTAHALQLASEIQFEYLNLEMDYNSEYTPVSGPMKRNVEEKFRYIADALEEFYMELRAT